MLTIIRGKDDIIREAVVQMFDDKTRKGTTRVIST